MKIAVESDDIPINNDGT